MTSVAIDSTPLVGQPTGIGRFVFHLIESLDRLAAPPQVVRYVLSHRAKDLAPDVVRLRYPATVAVRVWGQLGLASGHGRLDHVDVVHGTNYIAPPTRRPTVLSVHDCTFVTHPEWCRPVVRAFVPVVRRAVQRGAWVHTLSEHMAEQVREIFRTDRVRAIHLGPPDPLDQSITLPTISRLDGRDYVLALGALEHRKNLPRLVDAFATVHHTHPDLHLVLAGPDGPARAEIDAAIARLPRAAATNVVLTGWLDEAERIAYLTRARVLAYPSVDEGFGLPVLEAMQAGVPVVASHAGAIPEIAGKAGALVDPADTDALAEALEIAVTDESWRSAMIAAGHDRVQLYSWDRCAAGLSEMYSTATEFAPKKGTAR